MNKEQGILRESLVRINFDLKMEEAQLVLNSLVIK